MSSSQLSRCPRLVLIGNYGAGNIGDEALREYVLTTFPEIAWTVVTARAGRHPPSLPSFGGQGEGRKARNNEVPRLPFGVRSFLEPWWRTIAAIRRSDAVVFGGGSLFTDHESIFACALWWWHGFFARICGKPILLAFQGIGPFRTWFGEFLARSTCGRAVFISVRDEESLARVSAWTLKTTPLLTFDPVFKIFAVGQRSTGTNKILSIIPRGNSGEQFFIAVSGKLAGEFDGIRMLLLQPGTAERRVADRIATMSGGKAKTVEIVSVDALLDEVSISSDVLTQRYHGALAALAIGVPVTVVAQVKGDKLDGLLRLNERQSPESQSRLLKRVEAGEIALRCALGIGNRLCYRDSDEDPLSDGEGMHTGCVATSSSARRLEHRGGGSDLPGHCGTQGVSFSDDARS